MTAALYAAYADVARTAGARVAPVGWAWQASLAERPAVVLHDADGSHPTVAGSYLAACVMHATLFGTSPVDAGYTAGLDVADARALQEVALRVARGEFPHTDPALQIGVGDEHACAVRASGEVVCWGNNSTYDGGVLLGDDATHQDSNEFMPGWQDCSAVPVAVSGMTDATQVALGRESACARRASGVVSCWGRNQAGQLGDGTNIPRATPVAVVGLADAAEIDVGSHHACARRASGAVVCWGAGAAAGVDTREPVAVAGLVDASQISTGSAHTCAPRANGRLMCWGRNTSGQLGNGTSEPPGPGVPVEVVGLSDVVQVAAGEDFTCARRSGGGVACWGANTWGQLGNGTQEQSLVPVAVAGLSDATLLSAGRSNACAVRANGAVVCWGFNAGGQLGDGTTTARSAPVAVAGLTDAVAVSVGAAVCARRANGAVVCWGYGLQGQRGDGTLLSRRTPGADVMGL